jgi:carboxyl-terminal processing protease
MMRSKKITLLSRLSLIEKPASQISLLMIFRKSLVCSIAILILSPASIVSAGQFDKEWMHCVSAIQNNYYAIKTKSSFIDELLRKYSPLARQAASREQFKEAVNEMIVKTGDSHFALLTKEDQTYYLMDSVLRGGRPSKMPFIGAFFIDSSQGWKVETVLAGSSAAKAGLRKGDLAVEVNGKPFTPIHSLKKLSGKAQFGIVRNNSKVRLEMEVTDTDFSQAALDATRESIRIIERNGKKVGYIKLWSMLDQRILQLMIESATKTFIDTDAAIVDLRDGFGGSAEGYPDVFFRPAITMERNSSSSQDRKVYGYAKPLVLLTGEGTVSAKEVFAYIMKASRRAKLVGNRTAGKLLTGNAVRINSWAIMLIPQRDVILDGSRIEGAGIEPDIAVDAEYGPDGKDMVLEEAMRILESED